MLNDIDFEILDFISKNEPVNIDQIKANFPNVSSLDYRIKSMARQSYSEAVHASIPNSSFILQQYEKIGTGVREIIRPLGIYTTTDCGKKALQDYKQEIKSKRKELWLKNAWIPIIVSVATNLVISGAKWLWPLIQQWVSSFL